jgi:glycosyltransferase involved in cell wall biosynthesis
MNFKSHPHLVLAVSHHMSVRLLRGQPAYLRKAGFRVTLISSPGPVARKIAVEERVKLLEVDIQREISPLKDIRATVALLRQFLRDRPDVVNAGTPKAALLVLLAAFLLRVKGRVYTMRGLRLESARGLMRVLLRFIEILTCRLAHRVVCISPSLRRRALELRLVDPKKVVVIGRGSSNGIDLGRFSRDSNVEKMATSIRQRLGITKSEVVIGFVGRLVKPKGVLELLAAYDELLREGLLLNILFVGPAENTNEAVPSEVIARIQQASRLHWVGEIQNPVPYYAAMDILALPSYREGFGNVLIEAAAMELPVIATRIPGCVDAVDENRTGLLVEPRNINELVRALRLYVTDEPLRRIHGAQGRARVLAEFGQDKIWQGLMDLYYDLLTNQSSSHRDEDPAVR